MKTLPILTLSLIAIGVIGWRGDLSDLITAQAIAEDVTQPAGEKEDAPKEKGPLPASSPGDDAVALLQEARRRLLYDRSSVRAKLRETVSMGPRKFRGEGTYVTGRFPKLRLELDINVGVTSGQLLEVCDGTVLWTVQQIATGEVQPDVQVARTVISDVTEALEATMDVPETFLIAGLSVGGLPALLASLERSMTFEAIRELEEDGTSYSVIQGRWSDDYLNRITGGKADAELPAYMPDHVRIYFDTERKFPTRILYLRRTEPKSRTFTPLLSLEFSDVVLDGPVNDEQFQYTPPSTVKVHDRTGEYLKMIEGSAKKGRTTDGVRADGSVPVRDK